VLQRARRRRAEEALRASEAEARHEHARVLQENAERRRVESALREREQQNRSLAGRLISAQEVERSRIGRERVTQQLAIFGLAVSALRRRLPEADPEVQAELTELEQQTFGLTEEAIFVGTLLMAMPDALARGVTNQLVSRGRRASPGRSRVP
jgi:hypothetical protein